MSPVMPIRHNEVYGRTRIPSHVRTLLGSTGVEVYHEEGEPVWITYARPMVDVVWEQSEEPALSSELC
jgi:hypothetical protein